MALALALLACFVLIALGLTIGVLTLLESLLGGPGARVRRVDTRVRAADALDYESDSVIAQIETLRNVSQSA